MSVYPFVSLLGGFSDEALGVVVIGVGLVGAVVGACWLWRKWQEQRRLARQYAREAREYARQLRQEEEGEEDGAVQLGRIAESRV